MLRDHGQCISSLPAVHPPPLWPIHPSDGLYPKYPDQKTEDRNVAFCADVHGKSDAEPGPGASRLEAGGRQLS